MKMLLISLRKTKATASKCPFPPISTPIHLPLSVLIYSAFSLLWLWKKRLRLCLYTRLKASYKVLFKKFSLLTPPSVAFYSLLIRPYQYKSVKNYGSFEIVLNLQVTNEHATVSWLLTKAPGLLGQRQGALLPTATAAARGSAFHCAGSLSPNLHMVKRKEPGDLCTHNELHYWKGTLSLGNLSYLLYWTANMPALCSGRRHPFCLQKRFIIQAPLKRKSRREATVSLFTKHTEMQERHGNLPSLIKQHALISPIIKKNIFLDLHILSIHYPICLLLFIAIVLKWLVHDYWHRLISSCFLLNTLPSGFHP